jgi:hypothetical protein
MLVRESDRTLEEPWMSLPPIGPATLSVNAQPEDRAFVLETLRSF